MSTAPASSDETGATLRIITMSPQSMTDTEKRNAQILATLAEEPLTDYDLAMKLHLERGTAGKARLRLWEKGKVEPDDWDLALTMKKTNTIRWSTVEPGRWDEVRARAATRRVRRRKWSDLKVEDQAQFILQGLSDPAVYGAVMEAQASQRIKGRATARHNESLAAKRQRLAREKKQAERERSAVLDFIKIAAHLHEQVIVANGVKSFLLTDIGRYLNGEATKIPPVRYAEVADDLREVMSDAGVAVQAVEAALGIHDGTCPACGANVKPIEEERQLPEFVAEVEEVIEVDAIEL
jgi:hypothetical protein